MELGKLLVAFFIVVIFLTLLSLFTSKSQTGQFLMPSTDNTSLAFTIVLFSSVVIFFIKVPKRYYRPIPSRA
jgi:uncharacterized membrane protein YccC